jgi:uncharacterized membrane protein YfcA
MAMLHFVYFLALGLAVGAVSGMIGIGGGVLLIPALVWFFDLKQSQAAGITLAVLAVPVTLPAVWQYHQQKLIGGEHLVMAAWIAAAFAVGTFLGARVHNYLPMSALRVGFGMVLIYVAFRFILGANREVAVAAWALLGDAVALAGYLGLRALGRRYLSRPELAKYIADAEKHGMGEVEYHI